MTIYSAAEEAATKWHDNNRLEHINAEEYSSCFCCCVVCEEDNPHMKAVYKEWRRVDGEA